MQVGVKLPSGLQVAVDVGHVNTAAVGAVIRMIGATAARQIQRSTDLLASATMSRIAKRKERKRK